MAEPSIQAQEAITHVFRHDMKSSAKSIFRTLVGLLAVIVFCIWTAWGDGTMDAGLILCLAVLLVIFGIFSEMTIHRLKRNLPIMTVGPEGVAFPASDIGPLAWDTVARARLVRFHVKGGKLTYIRFHFMPGTLRRMQFGTFTPDRWEIMTSASSLLGTTAAIQGGQDSLIASVERFCPVER